jgi:hypothetical protein
MVKAMFVTLKKRNSLSLVLLTQGIKYYKFTNMIVVFNLKTV